jgi:superfamily II DNA or RNA helicase
VNAGGQQNATKAVRIPFTHKMLLNWAGSEVVRMAESIVSRGLVLQANYDAPFIKGSILWNNHSLQTALKILPDHTVESHCPCYDNRERGIICSHVIALGLVLVKRATDPERDAKYQAEARRAARLAAISESAYLRRVPPDSPGAVPCRLCLGMGADWPERAAGGGRIPLTCRLLYAGHSAAIDEAPRDTPFAFTHADESILFVLEDICEGPVKARFDVSASDFMNILQLHMGRTLEWDGRDPVTVNAAVMSTRLRMDLDHENGEVILIAHTELPFSKAGEFPCYIVSGRKGWVYAAGHFWPLDKALPEPYHAIYTKSMVIPRKGVLDFLHRELPPLSRQVTVEGELSPDLFTIEPAPARFRLVIRGSPVSLSGTLYAQYEGAELVAGKSDPRGYFAIPDPADLTRYLVRNPEAEARALDRVGHAGLRGDVGDALSGIVGKREVMNFLGSRLPALRRLGWRIEMEGRLAPVFENMRFATPVVHIDDRDGGWFDVGFTFEDTAGATISPADIQVAMEKGDAFIERSGRTILLDSDAIQSMMDVFQDCSSEEGEEAGHFRMSSFHAGFVKASLEALDGVDIEDTPAWRRGADQANRKMELKPVPLPAKVTAILRPYQREGVNWLRFLETSGFNGLLADEMGLGKTVQTLVWLSLDRTKEEARGQPVLIVCPTSLVENWAEESRKFTPSLKVLTLSGPDRHERRALVPKHDIVITSYALLRRDLEQLLAQTFSVVILDEAQHIKNKSTQNALAAKSLKAHHRLVLTGTPVENSASDLWSIMDFLMPGYLGRHDTFRARYEAPISRGGPEAEVMQHRLRRKLQPFLLRRRKIEVARDLPAKIEKLSLCTLTPDQRMVYAELVQRSRQKLTQMVSQQGFARCRMEILATLMRLRQACCHLELLKLPGLKAQQPSAKMEMFFELLDEAMDSGHRILVFSQFVSMLQIIRRELDEKKITYCYLDGSTKDRLPIVHQFNTQRDIPLFLISLKAGGTGMNLTGADMVVHFDPWWNPAVEDQATDRAHRIGQKRTVYSVKLIARDTVEEKVVALQQRKKALINATVESDEAIPTALTWEDVQELLSL